jgi:hypothetical protein
VLLGALYGVIGGQELLYRASYAPLLSRFLLFFEPAQRVHIIRFRALPSVEILLLLFPKDGNFIFQFLYLLFGFMPARFWIALGFELEVSLD